ncbi:MAG: UvrB/UvrC motif-containing protein [Planctomycetota bacterium]
MKIDIGDILRAWRFDPNDSVRKIVGEDGRERLQVRLPLGILQYEIDGRPDEERPHGYASLLAYHEGRLAAHRSRTGSEEGFELTHEEYEKLHEEGLLFYYRYVLFFQIGDYVHAVRDTERNLRLFDFCRSHAREEDARQLEQYRPYVIRMNRSARAMLAVEGGKHEEAIAEVDAGVSLIEKLGELPSPIFAFERQRSVEILKQMRGELETRRPRTLRERLEEQLMEAVRSENYERAAAIRDELRKMPRAAGGIISLGPEA